MTDFGKKDFDKTELGDLNYYLIKNMKEVFEEESEIMDNTLYIPDLSLSIRPQVMKADPNVAIIDYYLYSENWDREIFESSASLGIDKERALGLAEGSFLFGMMTGIRKMQTGKYFHELKTDFNGPHLWKAYQSDIVGIGDVTEAGPSEFWDIIKDEIPKYIGNQKVVYVKIFAARNRKDRTGECRINNTPVEELSQLISIHAQGWDTKQFGSKKQFFFFVQEDETYTPYPYTDEDIEKLVLEAAYLFEKAKTDEHLASYAANLGEKIGDYDLAEELTNFIPEICAERAFRNIFYPQKADVYIGDKEKVEVNKTQIASYYPIKKAVHHLIDHGYILKELYHKYISVSSTFNVIYTTDEKDNIDLTKEGGIISATYGFSDKYKMR